MAGGCAGRVILLINMYYYGGQQGLGFWLVVYLFAALLYAARSYTLRQEQRWQFGRVRFKPEIERDFLQLGAVIAVAAVVFGMVAPVFAGAPQVSGLWREISRPVRSLEDTFSRMFSGLQRTACRIPIRLGARWLCSAAQFGQWSVLEVRCPKAATGRASFTIAIPAPLSKAPAPSGPRSAPMNWRCLKISKTRIDDADGVRLFSKQYLDLCRAAAGGCESTAWIDALPGGDPGMWTTLTPLAAGDTYRVVSSVSRAPVEVLRTAGTNYPAAVRDRYLQLPDTLPDRVRELAQKS